MNSAAFMYDVNTRTVNQHYNFAMRLIHQHMEDGKCISYQQNIREQEPEQLVPCGLPEGVETEYNMPAIELDETLLTHLPYLGTQNTNQKTVLCIGSV
jgi:hypothetical protein